MAYVTDNEITLTFVSETWLFSQNNDITEKIKSYGYKIIHTPRKSETKSLGGGVAIICKAFLNITKVYIKHGTSFESVCAKLKLGTGENVICSCLYRTDLLQATFFAEFDEFIGSLFVKYSRLLICGDLNIHLDVNSAEVRKFNELISSYGLEQHVSEATHKHGHILDVI